MLKVDLFRVGCGKTDLLRAAVGVMEEGVKKYNAGVSEVKKLTFNFVECLSNDVAGPCHNEAEKNLRARFEKVRMCGTTLTPAL